MMATPKKKGLFRRLRTALSISKAARVAPAINLAAQLDEAVGIEGIDAVRQATNLDGEDAAAVKRWARRLAHQTRRSAQSTRTTTSWKGCRARRRTSDGRCRKRLMTS